MNRWNTERLNTCLVATRPRPRVAVAFEYFDYLDCAAQATDTVEEIRVEDRDVPLAHRQVALVVGSNILWRLTVIIHLATRKCFYSTCAFLRLYGQQYCFFIGRGQAEGKTCGRCAFISRENSRPWPVSRPYDCPLSYLWCRDVTMM